MESGSTGAIQVFYSYADKDELLRNELEKHLIILSRQKLITSWHHRKITAGEELKHEIDVQMKTAQLILLLVSPDFLASDYCYEFEMKLALERHEAGDALVVPILLRPVYWEGAPFVQLQALPVNGKPITSWVGRNGRDKAFLEVALGIRTAIDAIKARTKVAHSEYPITTAAVFRTAIFGPFHAHRAGSLYGSGRYQEAVVIYEEALRLDPNDAISWSGKGDALYKLERYQEAVASYEEALRLDPNKAAVVLDSQQETALQAHYVDKLSELLREGRLRESEPKYQVVRNIARLWTLTTLHLVRKEGKGSVLQFLYKSDLIGYTPVIDLQEADLSGAVLRSDDLSGANLSGANLFRANLSGVNLSGANLSRAFLSGANLSGANLSRANLSRANLFRANLNGARLVEADLSDVDLSEADFEES
jgi:tetratricopeptide (TPR) repeat protein